MKYSHLDYFCVLTDVLQEKGSLTPLVPVITCPPNPTHDGMHTKNLIFYCQRLNVVFPRRPNRFLCKNVPKGKKKGKAACYVSHKQIFFELGIPKPNKTFQFETKFPVAYMGSFLLGLNITNTWENNSKYSYKSAKRIIFGFMHELLPSNKLNSSFSSLHLDPKARVTFTKIVYIFTTTIQYIFLL